MWARNELRLADNRNAYRILVDKSEKRKLIQNLTLDGMKLLKWIIKCTIRRSGLDYFGSEWGGKL
jgi:hypothetical protein